MESEPVEIGTYRGVRFFELHSSDALNAAWFHAQPRDPCLCVLKIPEDECVPFRVMGYLDQVPVTCVVMRRGLVYRTFRDDPEFVWKEATPVVENACIQCGGAGETPSLLGAFANYTCTRCGGRGHEVFQESPTQDTI